MIILYILGGLIGAVALFMLVMFVSFRRGFAKRDAAIRPALEPIAKALLRGDDVSADEVARVAAVPQNRPALHELLKRADKLALFPPQHLDAKAHGEGRLAYWMIHPHELGAPPAAIEFVETLHKDIGRGESADFHVYRYRMPEGHWAGTKWLLGLAGPYPPNVDPYEIGAAFSRVNDEEGSIAPAALVDWYVDMVKKKTGRA